MRVLVFLLAAMSVACSWQQVVDESVARAGHWRLIDDFQTDTDFRWRLPAAAQVQVIPAQATVSHAEAAWLNAAQQGINQVFLNFEGVSDGLFPAQSLPGHSNMPQYYLQVRWPQDAEHHAMSESEPLSGGQTQARWVSLLGMHQWPQLPQSGALQVHLLSATGQPIYRASLEISPRIWGQDWHQQQTLTKAFFNLAKNLRGS